jgi:hypothetical protein
LFAYSVNSDGLTPLDVASLSNNRSMTKILLQHGALQGPKSSSESLGNYLSSPNPPFSLTVDVTGVNSVLIKILEPTDDSICTKFKGTFSFDYIECN